VKYALQETENRISSLAGHRIFEGFRVRVLNLVQRVDDLETRAGRVLRAEKQALAERRGSVVFDLERLRNLMTARLLDLGARWETLSAGLNGQSPLNILGKGYTLCWKEEGFRLVRSPGEVAAGEGVVVSFARGELACEVRRVDPDRTIESRLDKEGT
jgi:exodeoxyribonuclease VII large subunit